jgi:hypothetical protein
MFGTLKPHSCALVHDQRQEYNTFYCGLCKSLGDGYGTLSRALVSHDSVFLAVVADGLLEEAAEPDRCRCPLLPIVHRPTVRPDSVAMRYASAIQMLLGDQWLADRALEGKTLAQWARPLAQRHVSAARVVLAEMGISLDPLDDFDVRQAHCEVMGETGPKEAARPTMDALGYVFSKIVSLPGAGPELSDPLVVENLETLGRAVGGVIYWADALDDLKKDYLAGDFNPCLVQARFGKELVISSARVEQCSALLDDALATIATTVDRLPWKRHREIVLNILCHQLPRMTREAVRTARGVANEEEHVRLAAYRALPWYARSARQAILVLMVLWAWFGGIRATLAQDKAKRSPSLPSPSSIARPAPSPLPKPVEEGNGSSTAVGKTSGTTENSDSTTSKSTGPSAPSPQTFPASGKSESTGSGSGGSSSSPCSECGNACNCDQSCKSCCSCDDCFKKCCDTCDCNKCTKGCDCGSCCNGFDCGSCCKGCK